MGLVRDFMRMDIEPIPVQNLKPKYFRYLGELKRPFEHRENPYVKLENDDVCKASENVVVKYLNSLFVWDGKRWVDFHPGPCTDYDGPKPGDSYEKRYLGKRIYPSTRGIHDTANPFVKMAEEAMRGYEKPPILDLGVPDAIEQNDNMVLAKYNLKYIGETAQKTMHMVIYSFLLMKYNIYNKTVKIVINNDILTMREMKRG